MLNLLAGPWRRVAGMLGGLAVALAAIWYIDHRGYGRAAASFQARIDLLEAEMARRTAEAQASDLAHARDIDAARARVSNEVSHDYQTRLAAVRARYERLRATPEGPADCRDSTDMSGLPDAPGRPDAAAAGDRFPCSQALTATEQAMQLEALQNWLSEQQKVAR